MQIAYAHNDDDTMATTATGVPPNPVIAAVHFMYGESVFLILILIVFLFKHTWGRALQVTLFTIIVVSVTFTTIGLLGTTIQRNIVAPTHGPIHWHADFSVTVCGTSYDLVNPKFPSNKVGTPLLHEHDDMRIHIEGVPYTLQDITLGQFFRVVGGELRNDMFSFPSTKGMITAKNGDDCKGQPGDVHVLVEKGKKGARTWSIVEDPENYLIAPEELVPPGDRLYISFDSETAQQLLHDVKQMTFPT